MKQINLEGRAATPIGDKRGQRKTSDGSVHLARNRRNRPVVGVEREAWYIRKITSREQHLPRKERDRVEVRQGWENGAATPAEQEEKRKEGG